MKFLKTDFKPPKSKKKVKCNQFWVKIPNNWSFYSKSAQKLLFKHGYKWVDGSMRVQHLDRPLLWIYKNHIYAHTEHIGYEEMLRQPQVYICDKTAPCYNYTELEMLLTN